MTEVPTHRVYSGGYVVVPNSAINDERLSFRARGLLAYMLGRPPGWRFSAERLTNVTTDGRVGIRSALRELAHYGYYRAQRQQLPDGRIVMVTEVADTPDLLPGLVLDTPPGAVPPASGSPASGSTAPYVTTESQTRESCLSEVEK